MCLDSASVDIALATVKHASAIYVAGKRVDLLVSVNFATDSGLWVCCALGEDVVAAGAHCSYLHCVDLSSHQSRMHVP